MFGFGPTEILLIFSVIVLLIIALVVVVAIIAFVSTLYEEVSVRLSLKGG